MINTTLTCVLDDYLDFWTNRTLFLPNHSASEQLGQQLPKSQSIGNVIFQQLHIKASMVDELLGFLLRKRKRLGHLPKKEHDASTQLSLMDRPRSSPGHIRSFDSNFLSTFTEGYRNRMCHVGPPYYHICGGIGIRSSGKSRLRTNFDDPLSKLVDDNGIQVLECA